MKIDLNEKNLSKLLSKGVRVNEAGFYEVTEKLNLEVPCRVQKLSAGQIEVGAFSYFLTNRIHKNTRVRIGRYCSISENVVFGLAEHPTDWLGISEFQWVNNFMKSGNKPESNFVPPSRLVTIGNDVWIGDSVLIKGGVSVGNGAIIGAGAVVTKDVEPYAIIGGVPAKLIRYRFSKEIIEKLQQLKWWDYHAKDLQSVDFSDVEKAIAQIEAMKDTLQRYSPKVLSQQDLVEFSPQEPLKGRGLKAFFRRKK